jgi:homoserine O-acetyltransferase/O-succinyltransferase
MTKRTARDWSDRPAMRQVKNARLYLIPASVETRGHGTVQMAKFYEDQLRELLATTPRRSS